MKLPIVLLSVLFCANISAQGPNPIKVNQVGYYPNAQKTAAIEEDGWAVTYTLTDSSTGQQVWQGKAVRTAVSPWSGKKRAIIDFSEVSQSGTYILSNGKDSQTVTISESALAPISVATMKAFYLQRSGEAITETYAGIYARPAGHPDDKVLVHASATSSQRPEGTVISSPGGWYDAGDYNKYIVNSAFSIALMLDAYENNKDYFNAMRLAIPESDNNIPDFLDEIMVNLKWMQTMQDPEDGGVYHKLTTPNFEPFIMPADCKQQRYVVEKTTAAALDFAAVMAQASRVYAAFPEYKQWSETVLRQAIKAYEWAEKHPDVYYQQSKMNLKYDPDVFTGEYGDNDVTDERYWAAAELLASTGDNKYNLRNGNNTITSFEPPTWGKVAGLEVYTKISNGEKESLKKLIVDYVDSYMNAVSTSCYNSPYGNLPTEFQWGSNAETCAGLGIALLYAYRLTADSKYLEGALQTADYLLGRNATGYCYVTGFGSHSPKHPHHRLSAADGIEEPLPGFLVGGPNPGQQDGCTTYPSKYPDESYTDNEASYASNEIAINWNASAVSFLAWLDAEI